MCPRCVVTASERGGRCARCARRSLRSLLAAPLAPGHARPRRRARPGGPAQPRGQQAQVQPSLLGVGECPLQHHAGATGRGPPTHERPSVASRMTQTLVHLAYRPRVPRSSVVCKQRTRPFSGGGRILAAKLTHQRLERRPVHMQDVTLGQAERVNLLCPQADPVVLVGGPDLPVPSAWHSTNQLRARRVERRVKGLVARRPEPPRPICDELMVYWLPRSPRMASRSRSWMPPLNDALNPYRRAPAEDCSAASHSTGLAASRGSSKTGSASRPCSDSTRMSRSSSATRARKRTPATGTVHGPVTTGGRSTAVPLIANGRVPGALRTLVAPNNVSAHAAAAVTP